MRMPLLILGTCCLATSAFADSGTEAKFRFDRGLRLYEQRKVREALDEFLVSHRLAPNPAAVFNVGGCFEALGMHEDAFGAYSEYLAHPLSDEERTEGEQALGRILGKVARIVVTSEPAGAAIYLDRTNLGQFGVTPRTFAAAPGERELILSLADHHTARRTIRLERGSETKLHVVLARKTGRVEVRSSPPGAAVFVGDENAGAAPLDLDLPVGEHAIRVALEGHRPEARTIEVRADRRFPLEVALLPLPPPKGRVRVLTNVDAALVSIGGAEVGFTPLITEVRQGSTTLVVEKPGYRSWSGTIDVHVDRPVGAEVTLAPIEQDTGPSPWPWVLLGTTGASALVTIVLGVRARMLAETFEEAPSRTLYDEGTSLNLAADVMLGVSLALAASTIVLFLLDRPADERASTAKIEPGQPIVMNGGAR